MKTMHCPCLRAGVWLLALMVVESLATAWAARPQILSIRPERTNIVVTVQAPAGLRQVTLESRQRFGSGAWEPRAVARVDVNGGNVVMRIPKSRALEVLRVKGEETEILPAAFYSGTNAFVGEAASSGNDPISGIATSDLNTRMPPVSDSESRSVVESDIWQFRDSTLYYFNLNRGLQVIDVSNPDVPFITGTLSLPFAGEQMYLLDSNHVVLLARNGCYYYSSSDSESYVMVVRDEGGLPVLTAKLPVRGQILESRMVGSSLYVASQHYRNVTNASTHTVTLEYGSIITSFDLRNPSAPVQRDTFWFPGYGNVVTATDRFFFVAGSASQSPASFRIRLLDISAPDGSMREAGSVPTAGEIKDKFKIQLKGSVLTAISEVWTNTSHTHIETFSVADPARPVKLGELTLGSRERLFATRFDGDLLYLVTFMRIDPLWIVDLSNPARPAVRGELEVPGWSTYLYPMGARLLALGVETNRTTVSLFDVANPEKPALLSRVALGQGWSYSEANSDEKAFKVLPEAGLSLVPFTSYSTNGTVLAVQLVDLETNRLTARGIISHELTPRRATLHQGRILSISARELLSVDITDRDHPAVRGKVALTWPVSRLAASGDFLIELSQDSAAFPYFWWDWSTPRFGTSHLRVVSAAQPDQVLAHLELTNSLPVVGFSRNGDQLHVLQSAYSRAPWILPLLTIDASGANEPNTNASTANYPVVMSIFDLKSLPALRPLSETVFGLETPCNISWLEALWPKPGLVVWTPEPTTYLPFYRGIAPPLPQPTPIIILAPVASEIVRPASLVYRPGWIGSGDARFIAFDVTDPLAPALASDYKVAWTNGNASAERFAAKGLLYFSHYERVFIPGLDTPWKQPAYTNTYTDEDGNCFTNITKEGSWVSKYYLDALDYTDPRSPLRREPISIPGQLQGISHEGALLYTLHSDYTKTTTSYTTTESLDALAYDGVAAYLVASLPMPSTWPHPLRIHDNILFLGRASAGASDPSTLEAWAISANGKFTQLSKLLLAGPASELKPYPGMIAASLNTEVLLIDSALCTVLGRGEWPACYSNSLKGADGERAIGLYLPLGDYGVVHVPVTTRP